MNVKRQIAFIAITAMLSLAVPASANQSVGPHAGVFLASLDIGKEGTCSNDGSGSVSGGGLSFLPFPVKNAWYTLSDGVVTDIPNGLGIVDICGRLTAPMQDTPFDIKALGIGASCLAHKGWGGFGRMQFPKGDKWLSNVGWKNSAAANEVIIADVGALKGKKQDLFVGVAMHLGETEPLYCLRKALGDKSDRDPSVIAIAYVIIPGAGCDKSGCDKKEPKKP